MDYDAASVGNKLDILILEDEGSRFFETLRTTCPVTQHHIPEEQMPWTYNFVFQKLAFTSL